jgi:hypothetical protein
LSEYSANSLPFAYAKTIFLDSNCDGALARWFLMLVHSNREVCHACRSLLYGRPADGWCRHGWVSGVGFSFNLRPRVLALETRVCPRSFEIDQPSTHELGPMMAHEIRYLVVSHFNRVDRDPARRTDLCCLRIRWKARDRAPRLLPVHGSRPSDRAAPSKWQ